MDPKQIEKYMTAMERNGIKKMVIKEEGFEIELEREVPIYAVGAVSLPPMHQTVPQQIRAEATPVLSAPIGEKQSKQEGRFIPSPMIGTFYASSSPGSEPFVKVGDKVSENTVVCIVEAMKVMNEIKAGISGTIAEVLVKNGEPLEFGTKIFRVI